MDRDQIIKALEWCSDCNCCNEEIQEGCPLINVPKQSLAIIRELIEENERLKAEKETLEIIEKDLGKNG